MSYTHTTITQWPGNVKITEEIHEAIWDWQQQAEEQTVDLLSLVRSAAAIFDKIGTRMAPAVVAERCGVSIEEARAMDPRNKYAKVWES